MSRDYREMAAILTADYDTMLDDDPDAFDCLLYKAELTSAEVVAPSVIEDVVGSVEESELRITYADPVSSRAKLLPDESLEAERVLYASGLEDDELANVSPVVLIIKDSEVPKQSIISWAEFTGQGDEDTEVVSYYVLKSTPIGNSPVAKRKHYCIPLLNDGEGNS